MAFIVEDGTIVPDANSYVDVSFADEYFGDRGNTLWTGTETVKQGALIRATDYIEARFGLLFIGQKLEEDQSLSWPRKYTCFKQDEIPRQLMRATCEYAVRALSEELAPDPSLTDGFARIKTREKIGPLEDEWDAAQGGLGAQFFLLKPYPAADMLLRGLVLENNRVIR